MFAVCARLVAADPGPLVNLLRDLPGAELLVWTGTGEPPLGECAVDAIRRAFRVVEREGAASRVNFDVNLASNWGRGAFGDASISLFRFCKTVLMLPQHLVAGVLSAVSSVLALR